MRIGVFQLLAALLVTSTAVQAQFEVNVTLPACDYIIKKAADWGMINDPRYDVFCVAPGIYTYKDIGVVYLKQSGTAKRPRYLRWYDPENPNDIETHVVDIPADRQAVIAQFSIMADYGVIDRIVVPGGQQSTLENGASHNVLNRILIEEGTGPQLLQFFES